MIAFFILSKYGSRSTFDPRPIFDPTTRAGRLSEGRTMPNRRSRTRSTSNARSDYRAIYNSRSRYMSPSGVPLSGYYSASCRRYASMSRSSFSASVMIHSVSHNQSLKRFFCKREVFKGLTPEHRYWGIEL